MDSFSHSRVLFVTRDGLTMEFYSSYTGEDKAVIKAMIEHGSGIFHTSKVESAVCLVDPGDNTVEKDVTEVAVSMKFIWDCVEQNALLDMNKYVVTTLEPFRKHEDATIIKYVLTHAENPRMTLDQFFHSLSEKGVLNRDSYSIKSRAKRIYYQIETCNLSERDEKKFKLVIKPALMYGSYCEQDDYVILNFLSSRVSRSHEKEVYDEMYKKKILNYSSKSLFYRAMKMILPNIDLYEVAAELKVSVKRHLSRIYNIQNKSASEDRAIIRYIQCNIKYMRNVTLYKKMEEKKVVNCSAECMQLRFLFHILPNIDSYNIPPYFKERFKDAGFDGFSIFYDELPSAYRGKKYTKDEDYFVIHYLEEQKGNPNLISTYHKLEKEQILNRSANSIKIRFQTGIAPNIDSYNIPHSLKMRLKEQTAKNKSGHVQSKAGQHSTSSRSSRSAVSEVSVPTRFYIPIGSVDGASKFGGGPSGHGIAGERVPDRMAAGPSRSKSSSSETGKSTDSSFAGVKRKRRKCVPLPDSDTDSVRSENCVAEIRSKPAKKAANKSKGRLKGKTPKKQTVPREETKSTYAGDLFSYFLSQRSLPDDGFDIGAFLSQNSLVSSTTSRGSKPKPSPVDTPCFLQAIVDRCEAPPPSDDDDEEDEEEEEGSDTEESSPRGRKEYFPVDVKMRFMSRAISLLQNIEQNDLFKECVHDSLFYQKLVFRMYRINGTVYKNFLEKEVSAIMKKDKLSLTDKVFLVKYLACAEKMSPENPTEIFSKFNLR